MPLEKPICSENLAGIPYLSGEWKQRAEDELNETPEVFGRELTALKRMVENSTLILDFRFGDRQSDVDKTVSKSKVMMAILIVPINLLRFVLDDTNLTVPNTNEFLIRFLRARKFDSTKAFHMLQRYFLMKIKCPELFQCSLPSECNVMFELQAQNMLLQRDQLGRRVFIIRVDSFDSTKVTIEDVFRTNVLALEQIVREPETQIAGIVVILDMAGLSLQHAKFFTPYYAKKMVELVQETFPLRFKGFHVVNEPFYFDAVVTVLKPFLKEKIKKRIILHGNDLSSLHAFVSTDILPVEYGGTAGNFDNRAWYMKLLAEENYFKNSRTFGYKVDVDLDVEEDKD